MNSSIGRAAMGFIAGALSVFTVMTATWWALRTAGFLPANAPAFWSMEPRIAPFGVPRYLNLAFWGGIWGLVLALLLRGVTGVSYWLAWFLAGAIAVAGVALFVVPAIKGLPVAMPTAQRLMISAVLNGMFALGAGIWLRILSRDR